LGRSDKHLVPVATDLGGDRSGAYPARGGEHHGLARDEDGVNADGRSGISLCERGNDVEAVALDRVVGDTRYPAEVDLRR
jgi:hypothetical protein